MSLKLENMKLLTSTLDIFRPVLTDMNLGYGRYHVLAPILFSWKYVQLIF